MQIVHQIPKALPPKKNPNWNMTLSTHFCLLKNRMLYNHFATELFVWKRFGNSDSKELCFFWFRVGYPRPVWVSQQHGVSCLFTSPPICQYIQMWLEIMLPGASLWWFRKVYPIKKKNVLRVFDLHTHCLKLYMIILEIFYVYYTSIYIYICICIYMYMYIYVYICIYIYIFIHFNPSSSASWNPFSNGFIFLDTNSLCVRWLLAFLIR